MIAIGITGGIGSGKSVVAKLLALYGIPVYIADAESKRLTATSPVIKASLIALFGEELYTEQGLNKPLLASHIFNNAEAMKQVNGIIHPVVASDFEAWKLQQEGNVCAIESAILFESGFDRLVDRTVTVYAPLALRIERAMKRDHASQDAIERRIANQLSDELKKEQSDYIINNDDRQALLPQVKNLLATLQQTN